MLLSGWILSDLTEIYCSSCSTQNGHIKVIKDYLNSLKFEDPYLYNKITSDYENFKIRKEVSIDDYFVYNLNWIKINDKPIRIVFIYEYNPNMFITTKYLNFGYEIIMLKKI